jgi:hypothetical protein
MNEIDRLYFLPAKRQKIEIGRNLKIGEIIKLQNIEKVPKCKRKKVKVH